MHQVSSEYYPDIHCFPEVFAPRNIPLDYYGIYYQHPTLRRLEMYGIMC